MKPIIRAIIVFIVGTFSSVVLAMLFMRAWISIACLLDFCDAQDQPVWMPPTVIFGVGAFIYTIIASVQIYLKYDEIENPKKYSPHYRQCQ